jgi:hypothetical protein
MLPSGLIKMTPSAEAHSGTSNGRNMLTKSALAVIHKTIFLIKLFPHVLDGITN